MSDCEIITLHGGPGDGQKYPWRGGDVLELQTFQAARLIGSHDREPPAHPSTRQRATYRRSTVTRSAFVYQP